MKADWNAEKEQKMMDIQFYSEENTRILSKLKSSQSSTLSTEDSIKFKNLIIQLTKLSEKSLSELRELENKVIPTAEEKITLERQILIEFNLNAPLFSVNNKYMIGGGDDTSEDIEFNNGLLSATSDEYTLTKNLKKNNIIRGTRKL